MLLNVIQETKQMLTTYEQAQKQENQRIHIQNSKVELDKIYAIWDELVIALNLLNPHLDRTQQTSILSAIQSISSRLDSSQSAFSDDKVQQAQTLGDIGKTVSTLHKTTSQLWLIYTQSQIQPYKELFKIAKTLPEMRGNMENINGLIETLEKNTKSLPNEKRWENFHSKLADLSALLKTIEGLAPDKQEFLKKVLNGQATLKDISKDLLLWCVEVGLADSLTLRFKDAQ